MIEFGLFQTLESPALPDRGVSSDKIKCECVASVRPRPRTQHCNKHSRSHGKNSPNFFPFSFHLFIFFILVAGPLSCSPAKWRHLVFAAASSLKIRERGGGEWGCPGCPAWGTAKKFLSPGRGSSCEYSRALTTDRLLQLNSACPGGILHPVRC